MSAQVEERIVGLRFDNKDFERNVGQSMKTLDKFNNSLGNTFRGGANAITFFAAKIKSLTLDPLAKGAEVSIGKILALTAALTGVSNVADEVYNKVTRTIKAMSADQVSAGWEKYANYTQSMQTIMSATKQDAETDEQAMERVNKQMEKLMWFADETSYSLTDMTDNVGKFTSQGVELETAVKAMQGIALWAASAGQGTAQASRAMYNLSQALGTGSVRLQDWMSIENANMATKEVKQLALEAGVAAKTLEKVGDKYIVIASGEEVTFQTFRDSLKDGWLNTEALLKVTAEYGEFADIVYQKVKETGKLTSMVIEDLKKDGTAAQYAVGSAAFEAGQAAITFKQAIDSVSDAVSTQFMRIFQGIFGNYLQAKKLWTDFANELWDVFAHPVSLIADAISRFNELGFSDKVTKDFWHAWNDVLDIINAVKDSLFQTLGLVYDPIDESYDQSFIGKTVFYLGVLQKKLHLARIEFSTFTRHLTENKKLWANISNFFEGLKSAGNIVKNLFDTIYNRLVKQVIGKTESFIDLLGLALWKIGDLLKQAEKFVKDTDFFNKMIDNIILAAESAKTIFGKIVKSAKEIKAAIEVSLETLARTINKKGNTSKAGMPSTLQRLEDGVNNMSYEIENFTDLVTTSIEAITVAVKGAVPFVTRFWLWLKEIFANVKKAGGNVKKFITKFGDEIAKAFGNMFKTQSTALKDWFKDFNLADVINKSENFMEFVENLKGKVEILVGLIRTIFGFKTPEGKDTSEAGQKAVGIFGVILTIMESAEPVINKINEWMGTKNLGETLDQTAERMRKLAPVLAIVLTWTAGILSIILFAMYKMKAQDKLLRDGVVYATGDFITDIKFLPASINTALEKISELKDPILKHLKNIKQIVNKLYIVGMVFLIIQSIAISCLAIVALSFVPWGKLLYITLVALPIMVALVVASVGVLNAMVEKMEDLETGKSNTKKVKMLGEYILMVAISFLAVASAMAIIASISAKTDIVSKGGTETSPFSRAVQAMTVIFGLFSTLIAGETMLVNQFDKGAGKTDAMGALILKTGISILMIAFAMAKISKIPEDKLAQSQIVIYALLGIFGTIVFLVENSGFTEDVAKSIYALGGMCLMIAGSLLISCGAMLIIAKKFNQDELIQAGIVIGIMYLLISTMLAGATVLANWMSNKKDTFKNFVAIGGMVLTLAISLLIFTAAMKELIDNGMDWEKLGGVITEIVILLANIGAIAVVGSILVTKFGKFETLVAVGTILSGIMTAIAVMIASLNAMDLNMEKVGMLFLVSVIFAGLVAAIAFIIVAASKFATTEYGAVVLAVGAVVAAIIGGLGLIVLGIGLVAVGIGLVANAITELSKLAEEDENKIKKFGRALGAAFESFYVAVLDGLGIFIGGIIKQIGEFFGKIFDKVDESGILGKLKKFMTKLTHTIAAYIKDNHEVIRESLIIVFEDFLEIVTTVLNDKGSAVLEAVFNFLKDLLRRIKDLVDNEGKDTVDSFINLIDSTLSTLFILLEKYSVMINTLFLTTGLGLVASWNIIKIALISGIFSTISYILARLVASSVGFGIAAGIIVANFFEGFLIGLAIHTPVLIASLVSLIIELVTTLSDTLEDNEDQVVDAGDNLLDALGNAFTSWVNKATQPGGKLYDSGWNIVGGIIKGIRARASELNGVVATVLAIGSVQKPFEDTMRIKSPSKWGIEAGEHTTDGIGLGIKKGSEGIAGIVTDLGGMVKDSFTESFGDPKEILGGIGSNILGYFAENILGSSDLTELKDGLLGGFDLSSIMSGLDINSLLGEFSNLNPVITPTLDTSLLESQFGGIQSMFDQEQIEAISGSFSAPMQGMDSVTMQSNFDSMMSKMQDYMDVQNYNSANAKTNVNVTLDGDAKKMLKVLKVENLKQTKATRVNQLVTK